MGNEDSKLVDEGGGAFDPTRNYDKRTSRRHHRGDFEEAIRRWKDAALEQIRQGKAPVGLLSSSSSLSGTVAANSGGTGGSQTAKRQQQSFTPPPVPIRPASGEKFVPDEDEDDFAQWFREKASKDPKRGRDFLDYLWAVHRQIVNKNAEKRPSVPPPSPAKSLPPEDKKLHVYVRKRPMFDQEAEDDFDVVDASCTIKKDGMIVFDTRMKPDMKGMKMVPSVFSFDKVFDEYASNTKVYRETTVHLVQHSLAGKRSSAFVFGQTGSGKTYTLSAILSLSAQTIFHVLRSADDAEVSVSMFELYGTRCRDLLGRKSRRASTDSCSDDAEGKEEKMDDESVRVLEDGDGALQLAGLASRRVCSEIEFVEIVERGQKKRVTSATGVHDQSSRSHAFFQISIKYQGREGELLLVDLAGSERNKDSMKHSAKLQKEGAEINKSLMALKNCFRAQADGKDFVPYRASMLTRILKSSLMDDDARTAIIATVSPGSGDTEHSLSTLSNVSVMLGEHDSSFKPRKLKVEAVQSQASLRADRAYKQAKAADPRRWSSERVAQWWVEHAPPSIQPPTRVTGEMLSKWSKNRFVQHCVDARKRKQAPGTPNRHGTGQSSLYNSPLSARSASGFERTALTSSSSPVRSPQSPRKSSSVGESLYFAFRKELTNLRKKQELRVQAKRGRT